MRFAVLSAVAALALAVAGASNSASTATKAVNINASAFSPKSVTINTTDVVKWTNKDTTTHQIVANNGSFASGVIAAGKSYSHTFNTAGTFNYHDALHPALTGKVIVKGPPPAVTIATATPLINYGQSTSISGTVSSKKAGETVSIYGQPYGQVSPVKLADVLTTTNGVWAYPVKPTLLTYYTAHWKTLVSQQVGVQMRPAIMWSTNKLFGSVVVKSDRSLTGRKVYLQKFTKFGQWVKIRGVILGKASHTYFRLNLSRGRYQLRIFMSYNQVGAGYLDGISRTVTYTRK